MKKPLFKTIALLAAAFSFFVGSPIGVKGSAETENFTQTGVETVTDGGETGNPLTRIERNAVLLARRSLFISFARKVVVIEYFPLLRNGKTASQRFVRRRVNYAIRNYVFARFFQDNRTAR